MPTDNDPVARLEATAERLARVYDVTYERLRFDNPGIDPYEVVAPGGQPVLAPILIALAQCDLAILAAGGNGRFRSGSPGG